MGARVIRAAAHHGVIRPAEGGSSDRRDGRRPGRALWRTPRHEQIQRHAQPERHEPRVGIERIEQPGVRHLPARRGRRTQEPRARPAGWRPPDRQQYVTERVSPPARRHVLLPHAVRGRGTRVRHRSPPSGALTSPRPGHHSVRTVTSTTRPARPRRRARPGAAAPGAPRSPAAARPGRAARSARSPRAPARSDC